MENIAFFIAGVGAGLAIYRYFMIFAIEKLNPTICDFCQWKIKKQKLSNKKYNQTLIVITHDENIAPQADRIIAIEDGRISRDEVTNKSIL